MEIDSNGFVDAFDTFDKIEFFIKGAEDILNPLGYIPFVSSLFTADIRITLGLIQVISGVVTMPFFFIADLFSQHERGSFYRTSKSVSHVAHGMGNMVRAAVEFVPLLGNFATIFYDNVLCSRMKYGIEYRRLDLFQRVQVVSPRPQVA